MGKEPQDHGVTITYITHSITLAKLRDARRSNLSICMKLGGKGVVLGQLQTVNFLAGYFIAFFKHRVLARHLDLPLASISWADGPGKTAFDSAARDG